MSDYRIKVSVRNARLLRAIEAAGHRPGPKLADQIGVEYQKELLPYLNLTRSPLTEDGLWRECAWLIADFLGQSPADLWSEEQMTAIKFNSGSIDIDAFGMRHLIEGCEDNRQGRMMALSDAKRIIGGFFEKMTPREVLVIKRRFDDEKTLAQVGEELGVMPERVRQIEAKAIRKLRFHVLEHAEEIEQISDTISGVDAWTP